MKTVSIPGSVDYLVNECWPEETWTEENFRRVLKENGTPQWLLDEVVDKYLPLRILRSHPQTAYFSTNVAADILRKYKPDILALHIANIDHYRHKSGCGCVGAEHGFHPDKGPRPPFIAYGPDILKGVVLPDAELVDGAPTYAKIMGIELPHSDGRALTELIKSR